ncbi:hypothetical protein GOBAR_AA33424 [Gossypium barbadense]|uniref:Uncharacterized protein n=1 Tax=Gossypium barbadense TaxID=3634 RepID=A0A2P5W858_GOSBA|nr:hypothetical protein GOBAR_AA33424 [Gossypium barbadense]
MSYVDSQSTIRGININLNVAPETNVVSDDVYYSSDPFDHKVDSESDLDVDEVPDDIDDEGVNDDGKVNASSIGNQIRRIVIHNNPRVHMSRIDPDATHAAEFSEYPEILPAYRMVVYSDPEELFKARDSKIRKNVYLPLSEDHRKLNFKIICTCIMPIVKDMPTIKVSILIVEMQAQFQYRVSYLKAWTAKQMAMEQLYRDTDASYNELQGWIAAMREYVPGTVIKL